MRWLALLLVLAPAFAALAEDGASRLPFTPFSNAKEGDYAVFSIGSETVTARVVAVASGSVTIERGTKTLTLSTAAPPTVAQFFGRWEKCKITAWRVIDDTLDLGGLSVSGKHLTFSVRTKGEQAGVSIWFSPDVKGSGVALVKVRRVEPVDSVEEEKLIEFGTSQGSSWKKAQGSR